MSSKSITLEITIKTRTYKLTAASQEEMLLKMIQAINTMSKISILQQSAVEMKENK